MKQKFGRIGEGIKVVVDSANATGGIVGPQLYKDLGCEVIEYFQNLMELSLITTQIQAFYLP